MSEVHTVFGAGQIGVHLARIVAAEGHRVRLIRRGPAGAAIAGVTWMRGDVTDRAFADEACRGAAVVYNCANPPEYHGWAETLPPLYRAVVGAAARAGARLVQLDNLYMYGAPSAVPFDERTPMQPCSSKGELRKMLVEELFEAHARGDVEVTSGRASDFFGPNTPNAAVLRPDVYDRILAGGTVTMLCNPDVPHSYTYTPDVARGLAVLGSRTEALGRAWHLPTSTHETTRALLNRFAEAAGTTIKIRRVPRWALRAIGVVSPLLSAVAEMTYQWEQPFVFDDGDFRRTFGLAATPVDEAVAATLEAYRVAQAA